MPQSKIGDNVEFECSNGGILKIIGDDGLTDLDRFGADGTFAYYDDLHIDAYNDMTLLIMEETPDAFQQMAAQEL